MNVLRGVGLGAVVFAFVLCGGGPSASAARSAPQPVCSNTTIAGKYGFSLTGRNLALGVEFMFLGRFTADGAGTLKGQGTQNVQGNVARGLFTGEYRVEEDCSGMAKITFASGVAATLDFVIVDDGREVLLIVADQSTLESGVAKRIAVSRRR